MTSHFTTNTKKQDLTMRGVATRSASGFGLTGLAQFLTAAVFWCRQGRSRRRAKLHDAGLVFWVALTAFTALSVAGTRKHEKTGGPAGDYPYHLAESEARDLAEVRAYVEFGRDVDARDSHGRTRLHQAAALGQRTVAEFLIANGADLNVEDALGRTPLYVAVESGNDSLVKTLIESGADVSVKPNWGDDLAVLAMEKCERDTVNLILEKRAEQFAYKKQESEERMASLRRRAHELAQEYVRPKLMINTLEAESLVESIADDPNAALLQLAQMPKADPKRQVDVLVCLIKLVEQNGLDEEKLKPLLREMLEEDEPCVRTLSAALLARLGDKASALPVLIEGLTGGHDSLTFKVALAALSEGGYAISDQRAYHVLSKMLALDEVAPLAALVLMNSGKHEEVIPVLVRMLDSPQPEMRKAGAALLWKLGPKARSAAPALKAAERRESESELKTLMFVATVALGKTQDDPSTLLAKLRSPDNNVQLGAFLELEKLSSAAKREILPALLSMVESADDRTKDRLILALKNFGEDAEEAYPWLVQMLHESIVRNDTDRQFMIIDALGAIGEAEAAPLIAELLVSKDADVRNCALGTLRNMGHKARSAIPKVVEIARSPEHCQDMLFLLGGLGPLESEAQAASIAELLTYENCSGFAMMTLIKVGGRLAIPSLIEKLSNPDGTVRFLAATALGQIAETHNDPRILPSLRSAAKREEDEGELQALQKIVRKLEGKTAQ